MTDLKIVKIAVKRCEDMLTQVEQRTREIELLHDKMEKMIESVQNSSITIDQAQEFEMKRKLMKIAKKAAKKAAKKSLAIAQAKINMGIKKS